MLCILTSETIPNIFFAGKNQVSELSNFALNNDFIALNVLD